MSKKTLYVLGILLTAIIAAFLSWIFCCSSKQITSSIPAVDPVVKPITPSSNSYGLSMIDDASGYKFLSNENFNFKDSDFSLITPISSKINQGISKLKEFLIEHPEKVIDVVGLYKNSEKNTSAFPSLGLARANDVKNYLVSKGISSKQITTIGKLDDNLVPNGNIYQGPVKFEFETIDVSEDGKKKTADELRKMRNTIIENPLQLYFATNSSSINLNYNQRQKMADIARYIDKSDTAKIQVIGHTDNRGNSQSNIVLGLKRANTIKNYLVSNKIQSNKISTSSKGDKSPIATNSTEEGRKKNRRVQVTLK